MYDRDLKKITERVTNRLTRDVVVHENLCDIRDFLQINRVALYYFYREWKGQVTAESLSSTEFSILGYTGADDCFNDRHAALYQGGRTRAIADIEKEPIHECHRDFLRSIQVKANLVVPVLVHQRLWGLLAAHDCQQPHIWTDSEMEFMKNKATIIANHPIISNK